MTETIIVALIGFAGTLEAAMLDAFLIANKSNQ